jgi:hypothetical protein
MQTKKGSNFRRLIRNMRTKNGEELKVGTAKPIVNKGKDGFEPPPPPKIDDLPWIK